MDTGGSMDYEYENASRHQEPHHPHFTIRTGRGCPALAGQQHPWGRSFEWQPDQSNRPWQPPAPVPFFCPPGLNTSSNWTAPEPTYLGLPSETRASNPSHHSHDAAPHPTPVFSPRHSPGSAPTPASVPGSAPAPANPAEPLPNTEVSLPPAEPTVRARHAHMPPEDETRHSGPSPPNVSQSSAAPGPPPGLGFSAEEGQASSRRPLASSPAVRVGLPAPSVSHFMSAESRARHRLLSDFHRPGIVVRSRAGNASASPTSSLDDDSDLDIAPRMQMFGLINSARQTQILRGQMPNKRVASRKALASLQKVDLDSLEDSEKTCVICYNDFGVASPEGTVETPLRLPKCKHVFGDNCIRKWLEDSYSCPYCRDKLESELAQPSEQFLHRILASTGGPHLPSAPAIRRYLANTRHESGLSERAERLQAAARRHRDLEAGHAGSSSRENATRGERRAAPAEDSGDAQRRQRPRHESLPISRPLSFPVAQNARPSPPIPVDPMPIALQSPAREPPAQRTPAWHHGGPEPPRPPLAPPFSSQQPPAFHFPRLMHNSTYLPPTVPFIMPSLPQPSSPPSNQMPPMLSREDFYAAPPMIRDGGWYNSTAEPAPSPMPSSMEPHFPSFGSSSAAVTPGSGVFMPPLAHAVHYPPHVPSYGASSSQPQLQHPDRWGNLPSGSYYMS